MRYDYAGPWLRTARLALANLQGRRMLGNRKDHSAETSPAEPHPEVERADAAAVPNRNSEQLRQATADFWKRRTARELSREDARQMLENITGFFQTLNAWDARSRGSRPPDRSTDSTELPDLNPEGRHQGSIGSSILGTSSSPGGPDEKKSQS